ncbi:MAG: hypothetical protein ACOCRX_08135 [Candidatus Woesearchaeota archaeon]
MGGQKDFKDKLDKFNLVNQAFYFVAPNQSSLENIRGKFFNWVGEKVDVKMHLITLENFKKDESNWKVYDLTN